MLPLLALSIVNLQPSLVAFEVNTVAYYTGSIVTTKSFIKYVPWSERVVVVVVVVVSVESYSVANIINNFT